MQDLLSFIYKGEVNVKENHFEQFMKMAKMLQIKGLATSDDIENSTSDRKIPPKKPAAASTPASAKVNISLKPKLGAKRTLDKDDAEPSTSKRPARSAAPKSFEDPLDDESIHSGTKVDEPIQFEAIKCESVDLNVDPDATPFQFDYTEGEAGDDTGAGMGFDDDNDNDR
jgi:BTB/POZ domain